MNPNITPEVAAKNADLHRQLEAAAGTTGRLAIGVWPIVRIQGWGLLPFSASSKAHYFLRGTETFEGGRFVYSNCGVRGAETAQIPLLVPGTFPRCQRCAQSLSHAKRFS